MTPFQVKVCGITRPGDAQLAARLGADMIGLIFADVSPRAVSIERAEEIVELLPSTVLRVGVFVDDPIDRAVEIGEHLGLNYLQLHGQYRDRDVIQAQKKGFRVIRRHQVSKPQDFEELYSDPADLVMMDNVTGSAIGGTGKTFNWQLRPPRPLANLVLAGGLTAENVAEGVAIFRPAVVDVNSGVEDSPGMKSYEKLKQFFSVCNALRYGKND